MPVPGPGAAVAAAERPSRLRALVAVELGFAAAVLVATALLVNAVPGRTALAQPHTVDLTAGPVAVQVTVDPAKAGLADLHVYTFDPGTGAVRDVEELAVELRLPERDVGPLAVPLEVAGPGHWAAYGFDLPLPGEWRLDVVARISDVDQHRASATVRVR